MKSFLAILLATFAFSYTIAQNYGVIKKANNEFDSRGLVYFSFDYPSDMNILKKISVDNVRNGKVFAYASKKEFMSVCSIIENIEILPDPSLKFDPQMGKSLKDVQTWNYYPTYGQYTALMDSFVNAHPEICRKEIIGTTGNGRDLIILKISDNVSQKEAEPEFLYTSSIHGDELTGAILLLHLADYLLSNYGTDAEVTSIIDNTELWINPLANPDGTYFLGNYSVAGAIRYNSNFVDLNRNFPDPQDGDHPDGNSWQPETVAWMDFMSQHNFVMSANYHGGAELMNYPWDTWVQLHADDEWLQLVSREYADTIHFYDPSGYFTDMNNGISNGNAWYEIDGGRQDYANYFHHCREICIEVSANKKPSASQLPSFWNSNFRPLVNYLKQVQYGIHGIVTDSLTGQPLKAFIEVLQHDADSSQIYTADSINGNYHRLIKAGTYDMRFSSPGYITKTISGVTAYDYYKTILDVQLVKDMSGTSQPVYEKITYYPNPVSGNIYFLNANSCFNSFTVYDLCGKKLMDGNFNGIVDISMLQKGYYSIELTGSRTERIRVVKE